MTRWSLSNCFRKLSFHQFRDLTDEFFAAAEESFGTECDFTAKFLGANKVYTTFWDDDAQSALDQQNESNLIAAVENFDDMNKELWDEAQYVEVTIRPRDKDKAPQSAFAHMEFKGRLPRTANYYIQCGHHDVSADIIGNHRNMVKGDGFDSNGVNSSMAFMKVAGDLGMASMRVPMAGLAGLFGGTTSFVSSILSRNKSFDIHNKPK